MRESGEFAPERNYLDFVTPEECLERVETLVRNAGQRYAMMVENLRYYHAFLRPDVLVWNSLKVALGTPSG